MILGNSSNYFVFRKNSSTRDRFATKILIPISLKIAFLKCVRAKSANARGDLENFNKSNALEESFNYPQILLTIHFSTESEREISKISKHLVVFFFSSSKAHQDFQTKFSNPKSFEVFTDF